MVQSTKKVNEHNLRYHGYLKYKTFFTFLISRYLNPICETVSGLTFISGTDRNVVSNNSTNKIQEFNKFIT
jgi:hypothetical protein